MYVDIAKGKKGYIISTAVCSMQVHRTRTSASYIHTHHYRHAWYTVK